MILRKKISLASLFVISLVHAMKHTRELEFDTISEQPGTVLSIPSDALLKILTLLLTSKLTTILKSERTTATAGELVEELNKTIYTLVYIERSCKQLYMLCAAINLPVIIGQFLQEHNIILPTFLGSCNGTMLHQAAEMGYAPVIAVLLGTTGNESKTLLQQKDVNGKVALHRAKNKYVVSIILATMAEEKLMHIFEKDTEGNTALHAAAQLGRFDNVKLLLIESSDAAGALLLDKNGAEKTACVLAQEEDCTCHCFEKIVKFLEDAQITYGSKQEIKKLHAYLVVNDE